MTTVPTISYITRIYVYIFFVVIYLWQRESFVSFVKKIRVVTCDGESVPSRPVATLTVRIIGYYETEALDFLLFARPSTLPYYVYEF